jgi:hypothetical protein
MIALRASGKEDVVYKRGPWETTIKAMSGDQRRE